MKTQIGSFLLAALHFSGFGAYPTGGLPLPPCRRSKIAFTADSANAPSRDGAAPFTVIWQRGPRSDSSFRFRSSCGGCRTRAKDGQCLF